MKILFHSNLFPDASQSYRGQDNANLLHRLAESAQVRVIAPRALLPFLPAPQVRAREVDAPFQPVFPHYRYIPKVGSALNHHLLRFAVRRSFEAAVETFQPDVLLASWAYPDTCAVVPLARRYGLPVVAVTQGSDVHIHLRMPLRRRLIPRAFAHCRTVITRSARLGKLLEDAGVRADKLRTVYNGVDPAVFHPGERADAIRALGLPEGPRYLLYVGNYYPVKNPFLLLQALAQVRQGLTGSDVQLLMIGEGPLQGRVESTVQELGLKGSVHLFGRQSSAEIAGFMRAADMLCIPSRNEGLPNVLLEAFSCGLPIISTNVGGIHELLHDGRHGRLVPSGNSDTMAQAIAERLTMERDHDAIVQHAEPFSWEKTVATYQDILESAASAH